MYENRLFSACFIVWMYRYTTFEIKVDLCAHTDSKNGIFTRRVYSAYILTRTPSPYSAGWRWGLLSRKIFSNFIFLILSRNLVNGFLRLNNFFIFSDSVIVLVWFWLSDYRLIVSIFNISIFTRFGYAWLSSSTRLIFARYSLSVLRYIFLVSISTCFSIADSTLWLFNSLSLRLFCLL